MGGGGHTVILISYEGLLLIAGTSSNVLCLVNTVEFGITVTVGKLFVFIDC